MKRRSKPHVVKLEEEPCKNHPASTEHQRQPASTDRWNYEPPSRLAAGGRSDDALRAGQHRQPPGRWRRRPERLGTLSSQQLTLHGRLPRGRRAEERAKLAGTDGGTAAARRGLQSRIAYDGRLS